MRWKRYLFGTQQNQLFSDALCSLLPALSVDVLPLTDVESQNMYTTLSSRTMTLWRLDDDMPEEQDDADIMSPKHGDPSRLPGGGARGEQWRVRLKREPEVGWWCSTASRRTDAFTQHKLMRVGLVLITLCRSTCTRLSGAYRDES